MADNLRHSIHRCCAWSKTGCAYQAANAAGLKDHRPVVAGKFCRNACNSLPTLLHHKLATLSGSMQKILNKSQEKHEVRERLQESPGLAPFERQQWHLIACVQHLDKVLFRFSRRDHRRSLQDMAESVESAALRQDFRQVWRLARRIARKHVGAGNCCYNV